MSASDIELARLRAGLSAPEYEDVVSEREIMRQQTMRKRPTGETTMFLGWLGLGIGVLLTIYGVVGETLNSAIFGGVVANLGLISLLVGYVVNAISFLPGKSK